MKKYYHLDLSGKRIGKLIVIEQTRGRSSTGSLMWKVKCDCGSEKIMSAHHLRHGMRKYPSCGCWFKKVIGNYHRRKFGEAAKWNYFYDVMTGAKKRGYAFNLTLEDFLKITGSNCSYCGREPYSEWPKSKRKDGHDKCYGYYKHNGIDRQDNSIGYVLDNCVAACKTCNRAKFIMGVDEFKNWIKMVHDHLELGNSTINRGAVCR